MGLFGFGKKKHQSKEALEAAAGENEEAVDAAENVDEAQEVVALPEPSAEYEGRGDEHGPWDVEDENVPDYDEYLDMGSYYLPFLKGIELRVKANRATQQVLGTTITYGSSSVEIEAFAAPKTLGLWDDVRADLIEANKDAKEVEGVFGTELALPVTVKGGRKVLTRIVGVDGPRWMLRGIFSGINEYTEPRPVLGTLGAARLGGDSLLQNDDREPHRAACLTYRPRRADELVQRDGFLDDVPLLLLGLGHAKPLQAVDVELIGKVRQDARGYRVHQVWQKFR